LAHTVCIWRKGRASIIEPPPAAGEVEPVDRLCKGGL
jgi:hypothetical protein